MICSFSNTTSALSYHGSNNTFSWTLTFNSDGTSTATGGLQPIESGPLISLPNGSQLSASYDATNDVVVYDVLVMAQSYLAIGYGTSMTNTDMCYWGSNGASSLQEDLWSTGNTAPTVDAVNEYTTTFVVNADNSVSFRSLRPLAPTGTPNAFVI